MVFLEASRNPETIKHRSSKRSKSEMIMSFASAPPPRLFQFLPLAVSRSRPLGTWEDRPNRSKEHTAPGFWTPHATHRSPSDSCWPCPDLAPPNFIWFRVHCGGFDRRSLTEQPWSVSRQTAESDQQRAQQATGRDVVVALPFRPGCVSAWRLIPLLTRKAHPAVTQKKRQLASASIWSNRIILPHRNEWEFATPVHQVI